MQRTKKENFKQKHINKMTVTRTGRRQKQQSTTAAAN
jgi:hypothetical protein